MNEPKTCPRLPECVIKDNRCLRHQWYSKIRLSHLAQQSLLSLDLMEIPDEVLDEFIASRVVSSASADWLI
jgi:hypothetical protein